MDYATLQSTVLDRLSMSTDDPAASSVGGIVNEALHELETAGGPSGWSWSRLMFQADQPISALDSNGSFLMDDFIGTSALDVLKILSIEVLYQSNYFQPLQFIGHGEAANSYPTTITGIPQAWYAEGDRVYIYPTPDTTYTYRIRVVTMEPDLVNTTDTPGVPAVFHSAIVEHALMIYYELLQDTAHMQATQQRVDRWIKRMESYGPQTATSPRVMVREPLVG